MKNSWPGSPFLVAILLFFASCAPLATGRLMPVPGNTPAITGKVDFSGTSLYKATMEIKSHKLTGLILIKRVDSGGIGLPDEMREYRVVFSNEVGMTFFDLAINNTRPGVVSIFPSLSKKALIKILINDFRLLTGLVSGIKTKIEKDTAENIFTTGKIPGGKVINVHNPSGDTLIKRMARTNPADHCQIEYRFGNSPAPVSVKITNPVIGLKIVMKRMK